jgi:hypothetical protein
MSTRGFIGFVVDGTEKIAYNHHDSYPSGVGADVLTWLRTAVGDIEALTEQARALRVVPVDSEPTGADIERLRGSLDRSVGEPRDRPDWYQLLRRNQGNPAAMLAAGVIEDGSDFPTDSLFAEYGYVVDLDAQVFEVFRGFQTAPHSSGRFAGRTGPDDSREYFPCALAASWRFDALPTDDVFVATVEGDEDE